MERLAVIVPYRDREQHLKKFISYMERILTKETIPFEILIIHQGDDKKFNRAKLLNIGYTEALDCDYYAFHDVDMLPIASDYSFCKGATHLAAEVQQFAYKLPSDVYFGGVTLFDKESFQKINGYSNDYWGWGEEDNDVLYRCVIMEVPTLRKNCRYKSLNHARNKEQEQKSSMQNRLKLQKLQNLQINPAMQAIMMDGIKTLKYQKMGEKKISDHSRLITVLL